MKRYMAAAAAANVYCTALQSSSILILDRYQ